MTTSTCALLGRASDRRRIAAGCGVNLLGAGSGIGALVLFNQALGDASRLTPGYLLACFGLILAQASLSILSQRLIIGTGHGVVCDLRLRLVRRILASDIEHLDRIGSARILTSLTKDVAAVTQAFGSLPFVLFGLVILISAYAYLVWLSLTYAVVLFGMTLLIVLVAQRLASWTRRHKQHARDADDRIHAALDGMISGRNELALSQARRRRFVADAVTPALDQAREAEMRGDLFGVMTTNFVNAMMLLLVLAILLLLFLSGSRDQQTAIAATTTVLFIRAPLAGLVGSLPHFISGSVAMRRIASLDLGPELDPAPAAPPLASWGELKVSGLTFSYPAAGGEAGFTFGPADFSVRQGETIFIIGGNGSGKSTFSRLLTGLYGATGGLIEIGGRAIRREDRAWYRQHFGIVLSDYHLFAELVTASGEPSDSSLISRLLDRFGLASKVAIKDDRFASTDLSQGQRKRLALIAALVEDRSILLLDEWAADQDPEFRRRFYLELLPDLRRQGKTVIAITHDDRYFSIADRIYRMENGRLEELPVAPAPDRRGVLADIT